MTEDVSDNAPRVTVAPPIVMHPTVDNFAITSAENEVALANLDSAHSLPHGWWCTRGAYKGVQAWLLFTEEPREIRAYFMPDSPLLERGIFINPRSEARFIYPDVPNGPHACEWLRAKIENGEIEW
jgi:hypothetical protein